MREVCTGKLNNNLRIFKDNFGKILYLINYWKVVLLLNKINIFLKKHFPGMYMSNFLISVFLRMLKYFKGIIFLTINYLTIFDKIIFSRIYLLL